MNNSMKRLSGSTLKLAAIVSMLIDHLGAIVLKNGIIMQVNYSSLTDRQFQFILELSQWCRIIGRLAFPLFCFLLVEGFLHTGNLRRYMGRLLVFAAISEPIYDLAFYGKLFSTEAQNVLFTLLLGVSLLWAIRRYSDNRLIVLLFTGAAAALSYFLRLDGWYYGILMIVMFYLFRENNPVKFFLVALIMYACGLNFTLSGAFDPYFLTALVSIPLMMLYSGRKGISTKYLFYAFYPCHLLIFFLISAWVVVPMINN